MSAINIPPSLNFDGNDGPWSSFAIRIGNPAQPVVVLPATSQFNIWAVLGPLGCNYNTVLGDLDDCESFRGGLYDVNSSSTYQAIVTEDPTEDPYVILPFFAEQALGYSGTTTAGTDNVEVGWPGTDGVALPNQAISAFVYTDPWLALGLFGLSDQPLNVTGATDTYPSPLGTLRDSGSIPSSFWAYNAGARYLDPPVYGSLTLGGFDSERGMVTEGLKVPLRENNFRDVVVTVSGASLSTSSGTTEAVDQIFDAYIDSVVPEMYLPASVCRAFESAFDLRWNQAAGLYLLDDDERQALYDRDAKVTMTLSEPGDLSTNVEIVLPYAAFDLEAMYPLAGIQDDSVLRYFPLKQGNNSDQYYLGRTFLQEAYLAVDYNRSEFYLSQAILSNESNIKTVHPPGHSSMSKGEIAGIAVGSIIAVLLVCVAAWYFVRVLRPRQRRRRNSRYRARMEAENADLPDTQVPAAEESIEMQEHYGKRPFSVDSGSRQELDASKTARGSVGGRAELESPSQSSVGSPRSKMSPRQSYGFPSSPAELDARSPRQLHSRTVSGGSGASFGQLSPTDTIGRNELERTEEVEERHEMP